jgi:PAS domain S-box-containing protein
MVSKPANAELGKKPEENELPFVRILIVDDDRAFGKMIESVIRKLTGFDCSFVESAKEALKFMEEKAVDVVISDIKMPDMTGIELMEIIKWKYDSDVIMITGYHEDFTYEDAVNKGANDFIGKPVRPTELILRLKRVLRERAVSYKRKQAEDALIRSEKKYYDIFNRAFEGIFQLNREGRFIAINQALANMLGYKSPDEMMAIVTDISKQIYINTEDRAALLKIVRRFGFTTKFEARLKKRDGSDIWGSINIHAVKDDDGRILYHEGNVEDVTQLKLAEKERETSIKRLQKALEAIVRALAVAAEMRDPYTAGHQRKVANLACAIAKEMGLTADQIDGLKMASTIHDLGKISVPTELLSMPRKLTEIEFSLIKTHAQYGYDILKDIEFPWPIAKVILEHHERMDGSGYPNGLTGDKLLMESRIIAVADVVDAIASHRPYRPGFGIHEALDEISAKKGILYDADVVDACLKLFRESGYNLE